MNLRILGTAAVFILGTLGTASIAVSAPAASENSDCRASSSGHRSVIRSANTQGATAPLEREGRPVNPCTNSRVAKPERTGPRLRQGVPSRVCCIRGKKIFWSHPRLCRGRGAHVISPARCGHSVCCISKNRRGQSRAWKAASKAACLGARGRVVRNKICGKKDNLPLDQLPGLGRKR